MGFAGPDSVPITARTFGRAQPRHRVAPAARLHDLGLVVDLRHGVGSRHWFGGLARLSACLLPALLCLPSLAPFEAAPLPVPGDAESRELRAQAIQPLGQGGATGRHFAATDQVARLDSVPERATIALEAVLGENDDLAQMLQRVGLAGGDAQAVKALVAPLGAMAPGTHLALVLGPRAATGAPRPLQTLSFRPQFDLAVTIARQGGGLALTRRPIPIDATPLHLEGMVGSSLYRAARAAGAAPDTVQAYLQAIDQYMPFEAIAPSDQFELVVAHKRAIDGALAGPGAGQDGELLYAGIVRDGKPLLQVMRWGTDGNYYTADALADAGGPAGPALMAAPVAGNITSWFGMRHHPILGIERLHAGVDFGAPYGAPIYAASDGTVIYAGWHGGHGNYVRITHGGGIDTAYGHMSRIGVGVGMHVARGQVIGYVGATGLATGPHLHYELWRNGQPVDPLSMRFTPHHLGISPQELANFRVRMAQLRAVPRIGG